MQKRVKKNKNHGEPQRGGTTTQKKYKLPKWCTPTIEGEKNKMERKKEKGKNVQIHKHSISYLKSEYNKHGVLHLWRKTSWNSHPIPPEKSIQLNIYLNSCIFRQWVHMDPNQEKDNKINHPMKEKANKLFEPGIVIWRFTHLDASMHDISQNKCISFSGRWNTKKHLG